MGDPNITDWIGAVGAIATALALVVTAIAIVVTQRNRAEDVARTEAASLRQEMRRSTQIGRELRRDVGAGFGLFQLFDYVLAEMARRGDDEASASAYLRRLRQDQYVKVKLVAGGWDAAPLLRSSTEQAVLLRHGDVTLPGRLRALSTAGRQIAALVIGSYSLDAAVKAFDGVLQADEAQILAAVGEIEASDLAAQTEASAMATADSRRDGPVIRSNDVPSTEVLRWIGLIVEATVITRSGQLDPALGGLQDYMERLADVLIDLDDEVLVEAARTENAAAEEEETFIGEVLAYLNDLRDVLDRESLNELHRLVFRANAVMLALFGDHEGLEKMRLLFGAGLFEIFSAELRSSVEQRDRDLARSLEALASAPEGETAPIPSQ